MFRLRRSTPTEPLGEPCVQLFHRVELFRDKSMCAIDGRRHRCKLGFWTFFLPELGLKMLHARDGNAECLHASRPTAAMLAAGVAGDTPYTAEDWLGALTKHVDHRVAELYVASLRLARAGLGPWPRGLAVAEELSMDGQPTGGGTAGFFADNVDRLAPKRPATEQEILDSGVTIDKLRSCLRQQRRGYVIDLNSVVGVMPIGADDEVEAIRRKLVEARRD